MTAGSAWLIAAEELAASASGWEPADRAPLEPYQQPPSDDWRLWILEGGRGSGKTEACSRYFAAHMRTHPGHRGRIIAPTFSDAVEACVEGPSGLLSIDPEIRWLPSAPGGAKVIWPNGSEALVFGTPGVRDVERLRAGGNRHLDWFEEMAANSQLRRAWDQAQLGLRMGEQFRTIASTTPRATREYREIRALPGTALTHARTWDNPHLPAAYIELMKARYGGTRLGRQELEGLLIEDVQGALWTRAMFDDARLEPPISRKRLVRVVIGVDPAVSSGERADDTGIVVAALGVDGGAYILADDTCHESPDGWARRVARTYERHRADRIVAEQNNGAELVEHVLRTVDPSLPITRVHAAVGKMTRAEPVAALYEQQRVHHVGGFPDLEDECATWVKGESASPDRMDALVYALTELMLGNAVAASAPPRVIARQPWHASLRESAG